MTERVGRVLLFSIDVRRNAYLPDEVYSWRRVVSKIPYSYVLIYALRNDEEFETWKRLVKAGCLFIATKHNLESLCSRVSCFVKRGKKDLLDVGANTKSCVETSSIQGP